MPLLQNIDGFVAVYKDKNGDFFAPGKVGRTVALADPARSVEKVPSGLTFVGIGTLQVTDKYNTVQNDPTSHLSDEQQTEAAEKAEQNETKKEKADKKKSAE